MQFKAGIMESSRFLAAVIRMFGLSSQKFRQDALLHKFKALQAVTGHQRKPTD